MFEEGMSWWC